MKEKPKRRWLQIHLSTAIVLMAWLGSMQTLSKLGINLNQHPKIPTDAVIHKWEEQGFPLRTQLRVVYFKNGAELHLEESDGAHIIADLLIWPLSVFFLAFLCEWLIRRETRKP